LYFGLDKASITIDFCFRVLKILKVKIWVERADWPGLSKHVYEVSKPIVKSFFFFFQTEKPRVFAGRCNSVINQRFQVYIVNLCIVVIFSLAGIIITDNFCVWINWFLILNKV
jgi:hypothetical protein